MNRILSKSILFFFLSYVLESVSLAKEDFENTACLHQDFAEYLAVNALTNQLLLIRLSDKTTEEASVRDYIATVFIIWSSNRDADSLLLKQDALDGILRSTVRNPQVQNYLNYFNDPLSLAQTEDSLITSSLNNILLPRHLERFYSRLNSNREKYWYDVGAFSNEIWRYLEK